MLPAYPAPPWILLRFLRRPHHLYATMFYATGMERTKSGISSRSACFPRHTKHLCMSSMTFLLLMVSVLLQEGVRHRHRHRPLHLLHIATIQLRRKPTHPYTSPPLSLVLFSPTRTYRLRNTQPGSICSRRPSRREEEGGNIT